MAATEEELQVSGKKSTQEKHVSPVEQRSHSKTSTQKRMPHVSRVGKKGHCRSVYRGKGKNAKVKDVEMQPLATTPYQDCIPGDFKPVFPNTNIHSCKSPVIKSLNHPENCNIIGLECNNTDVAEEDNLLFVL